MAATGPEDKNDELARRLTELTRRSSGSLVAALSRLFGTAHLELAEDVVQEALLKAMNEWRYRGIPTDPAGWLYKVAKNLAIDQLRRKSRGLVLLKENAALLRSEWTMSAVVSEAFSASSIEDDQLRMFFACCHPSLPTEQQIALALKTLCGFSVPEIARAFVTNEETINKRLYRAREAFRKLGKLEIPQGAALNDRLEPVLSVIYLLFNEGYSATSHDALIREDLIEEALRLNRLLLDHPGTDLPQVHALLALMIFHAARSEARLNADGTVVLLQDQDRSKWDGALIALANDHLAQASRGDHFTTYHVEAAIASLHANAATYASTNWVVIKHMYDELLRLRPSPVVALNRAIAVAEVEGPLRGLEEVERIEGMAHQHIFHAVRGEFLKRLGRMDEARAALITALQLATSPIERDLLLRKLSGMPANGS